MENIIKKHQNPNPLFEVDEVPVHIEMDELLCKVLKSLGYGEGIKIFENTNKWYE